MRRESYFSWDDLECLLEAAKDECRASNSNFDKNVFFLWFSKGCAANLFPIPQGKNFKNVKNMKGCILHPRDAYGEALDECSHSEIYDVVRRVTQTQKSRHACAKLNVDQTNVKFSQGNEL